MIRRRMNQLVKPQISVDKNCQVILEVSIDFPLAPPPPSKEIWSAREQIRQTSSQSETERQTGSDSLCQNMGVFGN